MTDRARLEQALIAADKAGDTEAAKKLAAALRAVPIEQPVQPQEPAAPEQVDNRPVGDAGDAIMEPLRTMGTSAIATPIAGLAGIGAAATRALGFTNADPADVIGRVQGAMTYQPRTKVGSATTAAVNYPFEKLAQGADWLGQKASDATGSPAVGAVVNTAVQFAPAVVAHRYSQAGRVQAQPRPQSSSYQNERVQPQVEAPEYVAPDLVLEQKAAPQPQKIEPKLAPATPEARAKEYVTTTVGVDWNSLPRAMQGTIINVARDSKKLAALDPAAIKRQLQLQSLDVPVPATRGQITRDPVQLRNEGNVSATDAGKPIRETYLDQNQALLDNLEVLKGRQRGRAQTPEQVGISVQDQALRAKLELKRSEVKAKYKAAEDAGELQGKVSPARLIQTIRNTPDTTHFGWVESWLNKAEVVKNTPSGTVTRKLTLKEMEDLRQAAVARAMDGGTEGYYAGKVIAAIDQATEGVGGALYKDARRARREQALEFEETGAIARLVENKSRTDRATALEDTWRKTVISGSVQDLRNVKRSLLTGGDRATQSAGKRAWRDVRAQTIQYIKDEATKSVALNERGQPNITPAAMKRAIDSIGKEKIDEIFSPGTAVRLDRILEATRTVKTVPPPGHAGSSTMSNVLAFLERGLGRLPVVGDIGTGAIRAGVKVKQMGEAGRVVRESQRMPLEPQKNKLAPQPKEF